MQASKQVADRGGVFAALVDYDRMYESVSDRVTLVNTFDVRDEEQKQRLMDLMYTEYEGDTFDNTPACDCSAVKGEFNVGMRCTNCGTTVAAVTERPMESILWLKIPDGVKGFISPAVWNLLNRTFKYRSVEMVRWLADPTYRAKNNIDKTDALFQKFRDAGWNRCINHFIDNFDQAMQIMFDHRVVSPIRYRVMIEQFIEENRRFFFPKYLPIPNRAIFITEKTAMGTYTDQVIYSAMDAVLTIASLGSSVVPITQRVKENRTVKVIHQLSSYYNDYTKSNLSTKPGMFRRQVYGSRLDYSGRAVISSLSGPHRYDELHFPWGLSVMMFKTHITNKLLRKGMSPSECEKFLMLHTNRYHEELDKIFKELIEESPYPGLPILLQRNPSLVRGSAQQFYVTQVKPETIVNTISISTLALAAPNADFDGDEMNAEMLLDTKEHDEFSRLAPHLGVMDTHAPFKVSGNVKIPGPVMSTIANWMHFLED